MKWYVDTKAIHEIVVADSSWDAFDSLRDRDVAEFGMIVTAQRVDQTEEESRAIRTSMLFGKRWGKPEIARRFIEHGLTLGLPDTTREDVLP